MISWWDLRGRLAITATVFSEEQVPAKSCIAQYPGDREAQGEQSDEFHAHFSPSVFDLRRGFPFWICRLCVAIASPPDAIHVVRTAHFDVWTSPPGVLALSRCSVV